MCLNHASVTALLSSIAGGTFSTLGTSAEKVDDDCNASRVHLPWFFLYRETLSPASLKATMRRQKERARFVLCTVGGSILNIVCMVGN